MGKQTCYGYYNSECDSSTRICYSKIECEKATNKHNNKNMKKCKKVAKKVEKVTKNIKKVDIFDKKDSFLQKKEQIEKDFLSEIRKVQEKRIAKIRAEYEAEKKKIVEKKREDWVQETNRIWIMGRDNYPLGYKSVSNKKVEIKEKRDVFLNNLVENLNKEANSDEFRDKCKKFNRQFRFTGDNHKFGGKSC